MNTKEQALTELLAELFSPAELRRFVQFAPDGRHLVAELPSAATPIGAAAAAVDLFRARGLIDVAFFERLSDLRPAALERIRTVKAMWIVDPGSSAPAEHTTSSSQQSLATQPPSVFVSYSHRDRAFVEDLAAHLRLLQRQGRLKVWIDHEVTAGQEWKSALSDQLEKAQIILLMVSSEYLVSDFCWSNELQRALARHADSSAVVVPILLRSCDWHHSPFSRLQALPRDGKPVSQHKNVDEAWVEVARALKTLVDSRSRHARPPPTDDAEAPSKPPHSWGKP